MYCVKGPFSRSITPSSNWCCTSYLSHLLLSLSFGCLSVGIVVRLDQNKVVRLRVDHKFPGSVLQRKGHLIEDRSQFLQSQDSARQKRRAWWDAVKKKVFLEWYSKAPMIDLSLSPQLFCKCCHKLVIYSSAQDFWWMLDHYRNTITVL